MKRRLLIYSKVATSEMPVFWPDKFPGFKFVKFDPKLWSLSRYGFSWKINLFWYLSSKGNFSILVLMKDETVVHYSYITPKVFRFPFMNNRDMQVGPCVTHISYRGQGIFRRVLELIPLLYPQSETIWTYTTEDDVAAQKAFKNAGYKFITYAEMSLRTKIVKVIN